MYGIINFNVIYKVEFEMGYLKFLDRYRFSVVELY